MEKDIESIRAEYQLLSSRISRFSFVSLLILALATAAVSRADRQVNDGQVRAILAEIAALQKITHADSSRSFGVLREIEGAAEPSAEATAPGLSKKEAADRQKDLEAQLDRLVTQWFTLEASILGTRIELDVRTWLTLLPFSFPLVWCDLFLLRRKRALLLSLGAQAVARHPESATVIDHLLFRPANRSPYAQLPGQIEAGFYTLAFGGATLYLLSMAWHFRVIFDRMEETFMAGIEILLVSGTLAVIYGLRSAARLEGQARDVAGVALNPGPGRRGLDRGRRIGLSVRSWMARRPRPGLATGSGLVLLSLVLATAFACKDIKTEPATGFTWLSHLPGGVFWPPTFMELLESDGATVWSVYLDWALYVAMIGLAAVTLALSLSPGIARLRGRLLTGVSRLAVIASIYFWSDFFLFYTLSRANEWAMSLLRFLVWLVPVVLWWRLARRPDRPARWKNARAWLLALYIPGSLPFFVGCHYSFIVEPFNGRRLWGVPAFLLGAALLSAACLAIRNKSQPKGTDLATDTE